MQPTVVQSEHPQLSHTALSQPAPAVGGLYAYYVLGVLFVVYIFNFIDRQILAILLQPIKEDLKISDTALGFLTGFAFAVFYTFAGLPLARLADRWVRRSLIALSRENLGGGSGGEKAVVTFPLILPGTWEGIKRRN